MSVLLFCQRVILLYFTGRDSIKIASAAALWAVINILMSPIFWQLTHLPFICDLLAFASLTLVLWLTRKVGSATLTGLIVTALTLILQPAAFQMVGFVAASIFFDALIRGIGYDNCFDKPLFGSLALILSSVLCAGVAGAIIGFFVMGFKTISMILFFSGLHAIGGLIGGSVGVIVIRALIARKAFH